MPMPDAQTALLALHAQAAARLVWAPARPGDQDTPGAPIYRLSTSEHSTKDDPVSDLDKQPDRPRPDDSDVIRRFDAVADQLRRIGERRLEEEGIDRWLEALQQGGVFEQITRDAAAGAPEGVSPEATAVATGTFLATEEGRRAAAGAIARMVTVSAAYEAAGALTPGELRAGLDEAEAERRLAATLADDRFLALAMAQAIYEEVVLLRVVVGGRRRGEPPAGGDGDTGDATRSDLTTAALRAVERLRAGAAPPSALREPRPPYVPDAFPGGAGRLPNNPLIAAGMEALWKGGKRARGLVGGWRLSPSGRPVYQHNGRRGGRVLVYPNLLGHAADPLPTTEMFWSFVESLNPFTGDVVLAVLAQLCEPSTGDRPKAPLLEPVRITTQAIARYKGIQRWGMERRLLDERIFDEMEKIRGLAFDVEKMPVLDPATGRWDSGGASWEGDRFFDIVTVEQWQESLLGERERIEVSWSVRAGQWAYWWLNAQGRVYIGRMARALLELDHRDVRGGAVMAKKIGQHVVLLNDALKPRAPLELRIDRLLETVGELPEPAQRNPHWAGRTRDRFDEAILALQEARVFRDVGWPDGYGPGDRDRSRGWSREWLNARVRVTLPEAAPDVPNALPPPRRRAGRRRKTPAASQRVSGSTIRQTRIDRGWSQGALAQRLGITVPYLSQLETGKRVPSEELANKLKSWLVAT